MTSIKYEKRVILWKSIINFAARNKLLMEVM